MRTAVVAAQRGGGAPVGAAVALRSQLVELAALLTGCLLTLAVLWHALTSIVFPRTGLGTVHPRRSRYYRATWPVWTALGRLIPSSRRERFLSLFGPLSFVALLTSWAIGLIIGFALMHWSQRAIDTNLPGDGQIFDDFYLSGTSLFTLGFGDVVPHNEASRLVAIGEAGIGLMFVTAILGYLPVLYGSIVWREKHLVLLPAWAGSPPAAGEILLRLGHANAVPHLREFFHDWEIWCAGVMHSHLSHPGLSYFRSEHHGQSWIGTLVVLLDVSALAQVGIGGVPVWHAQVTFETARRAVAELTRLLAIEPDYSVDRLSPCELRILTRELANAGVALNASREAHHQLFELRRSYEPYVAALSKYLMVPIPPWRTCRE